MHDDPVMKNKNSAAALVSTNEFDRWERAATAPVTAHSAGEVHQL
jgi:hypothetical protein